jgi:hypothetical protein
LDTCLIPATLLTPIDPRCCGGPIRQHDQPKGLLCHDQTKDTQIDQEALPIDCYGQGQASQVWNQPLGHQQAG